MSLTRLLVASALLCICANVHAQAPTRKRVAVLEYRAGTEAAEGLGDKLAAELKKTAALVIVDPAEARRRMPNVDGAVARCGGDAACVAKIGERLGTDEVLLVGMSQLGDLVLSLQRIDVAQAEVGPHLAETLPADAEPDDAQMLGWLKQLYPPETFKRYGKITVVASVEGAHVQINGQDRGETPLDGPVTVIAPRAYRVTLSKDGYAPFSARIDVPPDANVEVRADLAPEAEPLAWYKRWYVWAIVGGVVAAGGIGTAAYLAQPDTTHIPGYLQH